MTKKTTEKTIDEKIQTITDFIEMQKNRPKLLRFPKHVEYIKPDVVLSEAFGQLDEVLVGGVDKEGNFWFSSSTEDGGLSLWILEHFKETVLNSAFDKVDDLDDEIKQ
jgi:hypothetical protein